MKAYVGKGLPRFTKRTLIAHIKRIDPDNTEVKRWIRRMRIAYRRMFKTEAPLTFDALDLANAYVAINKYNNLNANRSDNRKPCDDGVFTIFKNMLTPNVLAILNRKRYSWSGYYWAMASNQSHTRSFTREWRELTKESHIFKILEKAKAKD